MQNIFRQNFKGERDNGFVVKNGLTILGRLECCRGVVTEMISTLAGLVVKFGRETKGLMSEVYDII